MADNGGISDLNARSQEAVGSWALQSAVQSETYIANSPYQGVQELS